MKKKLLHIETDFEKASIKVDLVATIEIDMPPKKETELLISCRNAFIRKLWLEWAIDDLGMAAWTTIDDFLNDMYDVHKNGVELSFNQTTSETNHRFIVVNGYE
jgi:hypothetical protein